jgi:membrane fusion protein (multidrug efflux system)
MGKLNFNDFRVQTGTGTIQVRAVFANPERLLLPGQFARVVLHGAYRPEAILIPQQAAMTGPNGRFVYVVTNGKAEARPIETGQWQRDQFLVVAGLKAGEQVVVEGAMRVQPGAPVKAVAPGEKPAAQARGSEKGR